jgi:hypothetical protein
MPEAKCRNGAVFREIDARGEVVIFAYRQFFDRSLDKKVKLK